MYKNYTIAELNTLPAREYLQAVWGEHATGVLSAIDSVETTPMSTRYFLDHCTACGGNWGGMLLTGIRELYPTVWEAIPDDMGTFAWNAICTVCELLDIKD